MAPILIASAVLEKRGQNRPAMDAVQSLTGDRAELIWSTRAKSPDGRTRRYLRRACVEAGARPTSCASTSNIPTPIRSVSAGS